jgi:hypothetical protein
MTTTPSELPTDLDTAHELIRQLAETLRLKEHLIQKLQHQLELLLRHRFGGRSEKIDPNQLLLFAREVLAAMQTEAPAPTAPTETPPIPAAPTPKKNGHGRKRLPANLPR